MRASNQVSFYFRSNCQWNKSSNCVELQHQCYFDTFANKVPQLVVTKSELFVQTSRYVWDRRLSLLRCNQNSLMTTQSCCEPQFLISTLFVIRINNCIFYFNPITVGRNKNTANKKQLKMQYFIAYLNIDIWREYRKRY